MWRLKMYSEEDWPIISEEGCGFIDGELINIENEVLNELKL